MQQLNKKHKLIISLSLLVVAASLLVFFAGARGYDKNEWRGNGPMYGWGQGGYSGNGPMYGWGQGRRGRGNWDRRSRGNAFGLFNLDENQDGEITRDEAEAMGQRIFDDFDADKDGGISSEEFSARNLDRAQRFAEMRYYNLTDEHHGRIQERSDYAFNQMDQDEDGQLSAEEFYQERIQFGFERFDRDGNGVIERDEFR